MRLLVAHAITFALLWLTPAPRASEAASAPHAVLAAYSGGRPSHHAHHRHHGQDDGSDALLYFVLLDAFIVGSLWGGERGRRKLIRSRPPEKWRNKSPQQGPYRTLYEPVDDESDDSVDPPEEP